MLYLVAAIPKGVIEVGSVFAAVLILNLIWNRFRTRSKQAEPIGLAVAGEKTDKSILWGIPPHEFGGEIAETLLHLALLPEPETSTSTQDAPSLHELAAKVSARSRMSMLRLGMLPRDKAEGAAGGIVFSFRADCVRPGQYHVSQAGWNGDRGCYEMDEWIEKSGKLFNNSGMWADMTDREIVRDRTEVDASLWPEESLNAISQDKVASKTLTSIDGEDYIVIEMEPELEPGSGVSAIITLWIDAAHLLLRRKLTQLSENGVATFADIATFSYRDLAQEIEEPKWVNVDENDVIVRTEVDAVDHW